MSLDLTRKHLKTDLTKRAIIDESLAESTKATQQVKLVKKSSTSQKPKHRQAGVKAAAKPIAKRHNPYVHAVDEHRGSVKTIEKQLKVASRSLDHNASEIFFDTQENSFNKVEITRRKKSKSSETETDPNKPTLSAKAKFNLQFLTRKNNEDPAKRRKRGAEAKYAKRLKQEATQKRR